MYLFVCYVSFIKICFGICKVHSVPRVELGTKLSPSFIPPNPSPLEYLSSLPYGTVFPPSSGLSKVDHPPSQIKVCPIRFLISRHQQNNSYYMYVTKYCRNLYTMNIYRIQTALRGFVMIHTQKTIKLLHKLLHHPPTLYLLVNNLFLNKSHYIYKFTTASAYSFI